MPVIASCYHNAYLLFLDIMIKKFLEWIHLKEKLDEKQNSPPLVNEGDMWWISFGENVGQQNKEKEHGIFHSSINPLMKLRVFTKRGR